MITMRKLFALAMLAMLAAFAVVGCGQKAEEASTTETTPPAETSMPADSGMGGMTDSTMHDSTMAK